MKELFTAADLLRTPGVFSGETPPVRLAVIGNPVTHSRSPGFQNAALRSAGLDLRYAMLEVPADEVTAVFRALPAAGFLGANVTIPHKEAALAACDEVDAYARQAKAVNTLVVREGRLLGFNTDGPGLVRAIREEFFVDLRDLRVLLLGAGGGAGRAIAVQCALEGCERLVLANRTVDKVRALAGELAPLLRSERLAGPMDRLVAIGLSAEELRTQLAHVDLVINASSVGMQRSDPPLLPASFFTPNLMVYDTVYAGGTSRLLEDAVAAGARTANGLGMLLHQGALSFEIWFNRPAPLEAMRKALAVS